MKNLSKLIDRIEVAHLAEHPVWAFETNDTNAKSDRRLRAIMKLPVKCLAGCLVGTQVQLANGEMKWSVIGNVTLKNPRKTKHFLTVWIENSGKWFELGRYFDVDYRRRGPEQLSAFLNLPVTAVFPIFYDISSIVQGEPSVLKGYIEADPTDKLTEDEIISLALADD
jgi:hypothetical protein